MFFKVFNLSNLKGGKSACFQENRVWFPTPTSGGFEAPVALAREGPDALLCLQQGSALMSTQPAPWV